MCWYFLAPIGALMSTQSEQNQTLSNTWWKWVRPSKLYRILLKVKLEMTIQWVHGWPAIPNHTQHFSYLFTQASVIFSVWGGIIEILVITRPRNSDFFKIFFVRFQFVFLFARSTNICITKFVVSTKWVHRTKCWFEFKPESTNGDSVTPCCQRNGSAVQNVDSRIDPNQQIVTLKTRETTNFTVEFLHTHQQVCWSTIWVNQPDCSF